MRDELKQKLNKILLEAQYEDWCHGKTLEQIEPLIDAEIEQQKKDALQNHCASCDEWV